MTDTNEMLWQLAQAVADGWSRNRERPKNPIEMRRPLNALHDFVETEKKVREDALQREAMKEAAVRAAQEEAETGKKGRRSTLNISE